MVNYIKAELFRISKKKSFYAYFGLFLIFYLFLVFIRSNSFKDVESIISEATNFFSMLPLFIGTYIFTSIYNDDLSNKTLSTAVGFGLSKKSIVIAKFLVLIKLVMLVYIFYLIAFLGTFYFLNLRNFSDVLAITKGMVGPILITISYALISSIITYGTQKNTFSLVTYIVFASGLASTFASMALNASFVKDILGNVSKYLLTNVVNTFSLSLNGSLNYISLIQIIAYILLMIIGSIIAFNKKELEF